MTETPSIPRFFDSAAQRRNRTRAAPGFAGFDFLKREAVLRMADRLALMRRDFPLCLDFGCHDGMLTREIMTGGKVGHVIQADPAPAFAAMAGTATSELEVTTPSTPISSHFSTRTATSINEMS